MIPYGKQCISQDDIDAVIEVLKSDFLTQGPQVPKFESAISTYCNSKYAIAVNSATSGLHVACLALDLGEDDLLWTSPITFVASANCGLYCGAKVDFVDIDPGTYNISLVALEKKLELAKAQGKLPKVLVVVHMAGQSADMVAISILAKKFNFRVVEDASHAIGGMYRGTHIGSCLYSDITVFSFHPVKIITTAEGGVVTTNSAGLAKKMNLLRSHGVTRDANQIISASHGPWYYQQIMLGFNYRMTEIQAALGISQLNRLDEFVRRRHELAERYDELLKNLPVTLPVQIAETYSSFHLYIIRLNLSAETTNRVKVFEGLREMGIGVNVHYIPVHLQPFYSNMGFELGDFPEAELYYNETISLPLYFEMTDEQQDQVVNSLGKLLTK